VCGAAATEVGVPVGVGVATLGGVGVGLATLGGVAVGPVTPGGVAVGPLTPGGAAVGVRAGPTASMVSDPALAGKAAAEGLGPSDAGGAAPLQPTRPATAITSRIRRLLICPRSRLRRWP
jgi:hypothetical protein